MFKLLKRSLSVMVFAPLFLVLGLVVFVPSTFALDHFAFHPTPEPNYLTGGDPYEVTVAYVFEYADPPEVKFSIKKKGGSINLIETHQFGKMGGDLQEYTFKWDGKIGNNYASAGDYELFITRGFENLLTDTFTVENPPPQPIPKLSFNSSPPELFNPKKSAIDFQIRVTNLQQNDADIEFEIKPENENAFHVKTIKYTESGTNVFTWDGEHMGEIVPPGSYQANFYGDGIDPLTHTFNIVNAEPKIDFPHNPPTQHSLDAGGEYKISVNLSSYANDTTVNAAVVLSNSGLYIPQDEYTYKTNGTHEFSWDVSDYDPGIYFLKVSGTDSQNNITNVLEHAFTIVEKAPKLDFNPTPTETYTMGSGDYKASVKLTSFVSDTLVTAYILDSKNLKPISKDNFTYVDDNTTHEFKLDMSGYEPGEYELQMYGDDKEGLHTNILTDKIKVVSATPTPSPNPTPAPEKDSCAGYKDLKKTDWSCDAAVWAKDQGIITGQAGGDYFDGYSFLNRAEQTKIALVAYNKYSANTDYCKGSKPFLDVLLGQWYTPYICLGKDLKALTGYLSGDEAGKFVPARAVTVPEMFCILLRPLNESMPQGPSYPGLASNQWYSGCAKYAKDKGYYTAATLSPTKEATRFEVLNFLYAIHKDGKL